MQSELLHYASNFGNSETISSHRSSGFKVALKHSGSKLPNLKSRAASNSELLAEQFHNKKRMSSLGEKLKHAQNAESLVNSYGRSQKSQSYLIDFVRFKGN